MAFDQKTRNLLQRTITACRRVFDREFTAQLQELYGIQPDGTLTQCEMLDHLADEELEVARLLRSRLNHLEGGEPSEAFTRTQAKPENVARVIREQAFTVLNRLAALRLCEERGLVLECVRQGVNSEGFQLFMTTAGNALGETHEAYLVYLHCLFDELALDLGVLFDRFSPLALLFPRKDALEAVLRELNGTGKAAENEAISAEQFAEIWKADETIGWIYQYYNDEAERKKMREESSAPRNSRELAVRNQFFTPRYVVEFLTDNTLGRIWHEMRHGQTVLRDRCAFLVRRPTEVFLKPGEAAPESAANNEPSQEELLRQPVHIPHRALKDPREIKLLDPACGSMHFGLYAFDLFTVIYDEAWEIANGPDEVAKSTVTFAPFVTFAVNFSDKAAFLLQVPRLIIEHNIHGIDIDPRAAQIAGLSLWLRAQRAWHEAGIKPAERPQITRSNIVCAEPMPGEKKLLREFVEQQFEISERPAFAFLLEKIFDHMALAGEAGSLLRIEEEIRSAIAEASALARSHPVPRQAPLFPADEKPDPLQLELQGLVAEHFWQEAEQRIYDALEAYAEQTENGGGFQRRLFANDAAQGFAFIDLCRKRYDVAVMNPPFGSPPTLAKAYQDRTYPSSKNDLYCVFVERLLGLLERGGLLGSITSRTAFFLSSMRLWREEILLRHSDVLCYADFGFGVLDGAFVETAAFVLEAKVPSERLISFFRLNEAENKEQGLIDCITHRRGFFSFPQELRAIPGSPFSYWVSRRVRGLFLSNKALESAGVTVAVGLATSDNERFVRTRWEIPSPSDRWKPYPKGGDFAKFHQDIYLYVDWDKNGAAIKTQVATLYGSASRFVQNTNLYFEKGFTYPRVSVKGFGVRIMPVGCIFSDVGQGIFTDSIDSWLLLGILNSEAVEFFMRTMTPSRKWEAGFLKRIPLPDLDATSIRVISESAQQLYREKLKRDLGNETTAAFIGLPFIGCPSISTLIANHQFEDRRAKEMEIASATRLNCSVSKAYGVSSADITIPNHISEVVEETTTDMVDPPTDDPGESPSVNRELSYLLGSVFGRWDIRYATNERPAPELPDPFAPLPVCSPGMLQGEDGLPLSSEVGRRQRTEGLYPLDVAWDGILVDDPDQPFDIERRVHAAGSVLWADQADAMEYEVCELLSVPTLREWFRRPSGFFADHLKRYSKSRRQAPIYWPLSVGAGRYTLWLYYHRLTPDTLYKCLQQFVLPKLADVEKELAHVRTVLAANEGGVKERNRLGELEDLRRELIELRVELDLWAPKWRPNLNDGVLITAAPLWKLFRLPKWQKDLKACWKKLEKGDYDWSHFAYSLWPDRVREKCKADRSLAIAHGLEEICEVKASVKKVKKTKKTATKDDLQEFFEG